MYFILFYFDFVIRSTHFDVVLFFLTLRFVLVFIRIPIHIPVVLYCRLLHTILLYAFILTYSVLFGSVRILFKATPFYSIRRGGLPAWDPFPDHPPRDPATPSQRGPRDLVAGPLLLLFCSLFSGILLDRAVTSCGRGFTAI